MEIEKQLLMEIEKWTKKIDEERKHVAVSNDKAKDFLKNVDAYIADSQHFLKKGDLIRSFEAIIWSWSWLEILRELEIIERSH